MSIPEPVAIAILAKAPLPGLAKTRLAPALGTDGAAALQARFIERTVATARAAAIGPVTLWAAPDQNHPAFQTLSALLGVTLARQPAGDLGARMLAAIEAAQGPALVIGTDCPALTAEHLIAAAAVLRDGCDAVVIPVEDGGYALIGSRKPQPALFEGVPWSTANVMAETRRRLRAARLVWREPARLWDVDEPADLARMHRAGLASLMG
ncbi:TIGR04282 family arsenosugar biosynthesis glycosyltransferase [Xanthobacteraceae bacterium Astr-EGSB]|uniref:TIGR04282 family arsenosugar biosynthesis glycosyltransferase n=1 Tax=Astrobacterium formosum TaxID=3069710 RepID=UPI0027B72326|nr:TIGR04282 family arsenosugar biosynthesis glycosyltransferase [Xanthobacteraceae bacterium Astr-EGSB]